MHRIKKYFFNMYKLSLIPRDIWKKNAAEVMMLMPIAYTVGYMTSI